MKLETKVLKTGAVALTVTYPGHAPHALVVTYRASYPQGHPMRYEGLPRFDGREAAKVAVRCALAS